MKHTSMILLLAAGAFAAQAQTPVKPATARTTTSTASKTGTAARTAAAAPKLPVGVPAVKAPLHKAFTVTLSYQDSVVGTGATVETGKRIKVLYTGYRGTDGKIFDASEDYRQPVRDKDGKPVLGDDGKPRLGDPQPMDFVLGMRPMIPGFTSGLMGMKAGGQRRIFIPYQLAYGDRDMPGNPSDPKHPGIPAKTDLIFDVTVVSVEDAPLPPNHPALGQPHVLPGMARPGAPVPAGKPAAPGTPATTAAPATPAAPAAPAVPANPAAPAAPASPAAPAASTTPAAPAATATPAATSGK